MYKTLLIGIFSIFGLCGYLPSAFATLKLNSAMLITERITVQPIIVSDNSGSNTAEFFGNSRQQTIIEGFVDNIWAQAGIDVSFLDPNTWNNTFVNWGDSNPRPISDLDIIVNDGVSAGVTHAGPNVINMFFVNIAAGSSSLSENTAAGLAYVVGNGITQYVGSSLPSFLDGQKVIASVVAHEIGHNLGLFHIDDPDNLMESSPSGERLITPQITTALASNFSVAIVPLPAAIWLFSAGLLGLTAVNRRKISNIK